jgi:hypothetical protein
MTDVFEILHLTRSRGECQFKIILSDLFSLLTIEVNGEALRIGFDNVDYGEALCG